MLHFGVHMLVVNDTNGIKCPLAMSPVNQSPCRPVLEQDGTCVLWRNDRWVHHGVDSGFGRARGLRAWQ
jgi:hypothetical protein